MKNSRRLKGVAVSLIMIVAGCRSAGQLVQVVRAPVAPPTPAATSGAKGSPAFAAVWTISLHGADGNLQIYSARQGDRELEYDKDKDGGVAVVHLPDTTALLVHLNEWRPGFARVEAAAVVHHGSIRVVFLDVKQPSVTVDPTGETVHVTLSAESSELCRTGSCSFAIDMVAALPPELRNRFATSPR
jgi:hypothetical protein